MKDTKNRNMEDIAIVGMVCRFPDANNKEQFWQNLLAGKESVRPLSEQELKEWGMASFVDDPDYVNAAAVIDDATCFDYRFFGYSRKEAELMDPQQRLFLQSCWHALEDAGYIPDAENGQVGVFAAARMSSWINQFPLLDSRQLSTTEGFQTLMGNDKDYLATRVAYKLGCTGPAMTIQTACSSSLVAIYQACRSIQNGDCTMALAGGAALSFPQGCGYQRNDGMIFSPDGQCRPFSADANGIVGGSGVGVIVLKRLSDARKDNDRVYAVIKGGAINNDGNRKVGYTAPGGQSQQDVIEQALDRAGVDPANIGYLEAHGTGTVLGDPIELRSVSTAWQQYTQESGYCAIGSVKGNIGHLDTTAGVASIIKTALALYHNRIPPSINCSALNPSIDFAQSPFFVAKEVTDWPLEGIRYAAVSCFGIGGTNSHLVLGQSSDADLPKSSKAPQDDDYSLLEISAPDEASLRRQLGGWQQALSDYSLLPDSEQQGTINDWVKASHHLRKQHACKQVIAAHSISDALDQITHSIQTSAEQSYQIGTRSKAPIMMFSGQGAQWSGMGRTLFEHSDVYRNAVTQCSGWMADALQLEITELMFGQDSRLDDSRYAQPAIFAHQYALYSYYCSVGVKPIAVLGHSLGEYMAAVAAGVMDARQAAILVVERAALMASIPVAGAMISVSTDVETLDEFHPQWRETLDLAAVNRKDELVLSGLVASVDAIEKQLSATGIRVHRLSISLPCHSRWLEPIYSDFAAKVAKVSLKAPSLPFWSTVTGEQLDASSVCHREYWANQLLKPVCFSQALHAVCEKYQAPLLEIGPSKVLSRYVSNDVPACSAQLRHGDGVRDFWQSLAWLATHGVAVSSPTAIETKPVVRTLPLPLYSFAMDECRPVLSELVAEQSTVAGKDSDVSLILKQAVAETDEETLTAYPLMLEISDRFVAHYAWQALRQCGWLPDSGCVEKHWEQQAIPEARFPLLRRLVRPLQACGYLCQNGEGLQIRVDHPVEQVEALHHDFRHHFNLAMKADFDDLVDLLISCGKHLAGMLTGDINPVDIVFRDNGAAVLNRFYSETVNAKVVNKWLANTVLSLYEKHKRSGHSVLRIMEVGAGTGASTQAVLSALQGADIEYLFTDVSMSFIDQARERFGHISGVDFALYDLDDCHSQPAEQLEQPFDLIIAANSLHASKHVGKALERLTPLLSSQGHLLLRELTVPYAVFDLLFGPLAAIPEDSDLRGDDLILAGHQWQRLLTEQHFAEVKLAPASGSPLSILGENVILACRSDKTAEHDSQSISNGTLIDGLGWRLDVSQPVYNVPWQADGDWWAFSLLALNALRDVLGDGVYRYQKILRQELPLNTAVNSPVQAQLLVHVGAGGQGKVQLMLPGNNDWHQHYSLHYQRRAVLPLHTETEQTPLEKVELNWDSQGRNAWWPESLVCDTRLGVEPSVDWSALSCLGTSQTGQPQEIRLHLENCLSGELKAVGISDRPSQEIKSLAVNEAVSNIALSNYDWQWQPVSDMDLQLRKEMVEPLWSEDNVTYLLGAEGSAWVAQARQLIEGQGGTVKFQALSAPLAVAQWVNEFNCQPPAGIVFIHEPAQPKPRLHTDNKSFSVQGIDELQLVGESLFNIVQAMQQADLPLSSMPLMLLTSKGGDLSQASAVDPISASLVQMLRCTRNEVADLKISALNFDDPTALSIDLLQYADSPFQLSLTNGRLCYPVLAKKTLPVSIAKPVIRPGALYLVFGLGGIGRWLVQWLVKQGADQIAIWLRREPNAEQHQWLTELRQSGVQVHLNCDVEATSVLAIESAWSKLPVAPTGIFMTVGEAVSARIEQLDWSRCWLGMASKMVASNTLVKLGEQAEFIQLLSSSSTLTAMPGLLPYVVANSYVENLAAQRWHQGYPVMAVAWGNWYQTGMDSGFDEAALNRMGFYSQEPREVAELQNGLLALGGGVNTICKIEWQQFVTQHGGLAANLMRFDQLTASARSEQGHGYRKRQQLSDQRVALRKMSPEQQKNHIQSVLTGLLSDRLQIAENQLTDSVDLFAIGMDSLVFVDFSQALRQLFQLRFPVSESYQYRTFGDLLAQVYQRYVDSEIDFENLLHTDDKVIPVLETRGQPFPMTDLQQAFWIGRNDSLALGSVSCHQYSELELEDFDLPRFEKAWNTLIHRHDMLRCIVLEDGQQQVLDDVPYYHIPQRDLRGLSESDKQHQLDATRESMTYQVLDPCCWPLFDIRATQVDDTVTRLHIDLDVLMIDVHSFRILYGELNRLMQEPERVLLPLQLAFRDCVQQEYLERTQPDYQKAQAYWQDRAGSLPPAPQLPLRTNPENLTKPRFRTLTEVVNRQVWQRLKQRAATQGATGTAVILAAFSEVLKRWTRDPHFSLNMTYYNRKAVHEQVMDIVGDFTSIMLLEADLREGKSFSDRVGELQQELWLNLDHRQFSGVEVMREMARQAEGSGRQVHMPVVFTSLIGMDFDNSENADWDLMGKQIHQVNQTPQVWLDYQLVEYGGNLLNRWFIVDQLFEPAVIEAMFVAFNQLLEYLAREDVDWGQTVTGLPTIAGLPDHAERNVVIKQRSDSLMHELFVQQARKTPHHPALLASCRQWSYQELLQWVCRLSHRLVQSGVQRGDRVAIVMDKCPANVAAALAVQCVGAAYIPVAMEGAARCQAILNDCEPALVLTTPEWADELNDRCLSAELNLPIYLADEASLAELPDWFEPVAMESDEPAYLIYTSGSTGKPKGVLLDHRAPLNTVMAMNEHFSITESDRFLSLTPPNHDMAVYDIYGPLAVGGAVVIPEADQRKEVPEWLALMAHYKVSVLNVVPTFIDMLVSYLELSGQSNAVNQLPEALRVVMMGGDWIPLSLPSRVRNYWPDIDLHSIGGPTETAIVSVTYAIGEVDTSWESIPYGKPLANQKMYIMNADLEPCPEGVAGEICVTGQCLALEYYNDPKQTASRFVINPANGERVYRTGDAGSFLPDGNIQILGRLDQQLSVHGYRIEPGEIESCIKRVAKVKDAVIVKAGESSTLHAYVVPEFHLDEKEAGESEVNDACDVVNVLAATKAEIVPDLATIRCVACEEVARLPADLSVAGYHDFFSQLERYSLMIMWRFIRTFERRGTVNLDTITSHLSVKENYLHLLHSWFTELESEGVYRRSEEQGSYSVLKQWDDEQWQAAQNWFDSYLGQCDNNELSIWQFFLYCTDHLDGLLTGEINPLEHMFRGGNTDLAESFYQRNRVPRHFNRVAGEAVAELMAQWPADKPVRVLEFGAGVGSITASVLPQLPENKTDYLFTDLSTFFFDKAREKFGDYPFLRYELFDINDDPFEQGFEPGQFDLIIGANVLHDACNVDITSAYLKELLAPGGVMMVLEGTYNPRFQLVSFGFIEGLTQYQDERVETHLPLLPASRWCQLLEQSGFAKVGAIPEAGMAEEVFNYHLMLAQAPSEHPVLHWSPLIGRLRKELPEYMVPTNFHLIRQLPISANGKVDRKALSQRNQTVLKTEYKAHRALTQTEQQLAKIWQQVLHPESTSSESTSLEINNPEGNNSESNFFAAGGDSLLMTRIAGLIKRQWQIELSLGSLLAAPILSEQAELIDAANLLIGSVGEREEDDLMPMYDFEEGEL